MAERRRRETQTRLNEATYHNPFSFRGFPIAAKESYIYREQFGIYCIQST